MYKVMISVGEASGDLHGASVATALRNIQPGIKMLGMGGQAMRSAGVDIVHDIADLGVIGFVEVIKNLPRLFKLRDSLVDLMAAERPDVLVIIDYPDFNMRLAAKAKQLGIPIVSYISPSAWAWRKGRAKNVAKLVDRLAAIFPFEADVYREAGANVTFVGHPLLDIVQPCLTKTEAYAFFKAKADQPIVLLLPGSRNQEINTLLPVMLAAGEKIVEQVPDCQFFLPVASTISREMLQNILSQYKLKVNLTNEYTYDLMVIADSAIAASGTVTLEAALLKLPSVVIYKLAALTYLLGKFLVKIPHFSLPNIIAGRQIIPELLQDQANAANIAQAVLPMLQDDIEKKRLQQDLAEVRHKLGDVGAVDRVARVILEVAQEKAGGTNEHL
ncbi:lipid-A-disaccharide synthase [Sporomusaceae bacterium FL31]|nr:lipid-A-disaccharide synthase [Sporomusaceae bacterium FL31]GCE33947.1 lipid-A-disaccharide synthase [Sporomusaceae bacterium]